MSRSTRFPSALPRFSLPASAQAFRRDGFCSASRLVLGASLLLLPGLASRALAEDADGAAAAPVQVPAIDVTGQKDGNGGAREDSAENGYRATTQSVTPLGKVPLKDMPYSINVTSGELIENSNAHSLVDAVKTNPTASMLMSSGGYTSMTRLMVRGFTAADQSELRDGLVDRSFSYPPIENVDRIEILNGFSSFFQGFSSPGGVVNYVSKGPTEQPMEAVTLGNYGGGINFAQADIGGPVDATDGKLGYRLNAYKEDGSTYVDGSNQNRALISGVAKYNFTPGTSLTADLWHQDYEDTGLQTYFSNGTDGNWSTSSAVPSASSFKASTQYGQDWTYNKTEKTLAGLRFESELNDTVTVRAGYRHGYMWRQYDYVKAQNLKSDGSYTETNLASPRQTERTDSTYEMADVHFDTWGVRHTLTGGYSGTYYFYERGADKTTALGSSSIYSTVSYSDPDTAVGALNSWSNVRYNSLLAGDKIDFDDQWSVLVGTNHAEIVSRSWTSTSLTKYSQSGDSPTYALIYKPLSNVSTYASYVQALQAGGTAPSTAANANQMLAPYKSDQYETGVKTTLGGMDVNAALFYIDMVNQETDPNDNVYKQDGREIHQGLEFTASGKVMPRLTFVGGFTLMDAHVEQANADKLAEGRTPANVPEQQASAYLEYALPWVPDMSVTGGVNYYGKRPTDSHDVNYLASATIFNAGLRYEPELYGHKTSVNLTVSNLFDTAYWAYYRSGDGLLLGAPRVVSLSLKTTW